MLSRRTFPVWIGIVLLSGMFLMGQETWPPACVDTDGDGYGNPASASCAQPGLDCDDSNAAVNPGALEGPYGDPVCGDALDNDCDGPVDGADPGCRPTQSLVPDTGIMTCYNNTEAIECPALGQPFFGQDAQYVTNPMSYTVSPDGLTVLDNVTGLEWQRCPAGLSGSDCSSGSAETFTWANAITYCEGLDLGGYTDWRLPDEYELQSIVDYSRYNPAIDPVAFPATTSGGYWSSSLFNYSKLYAWYVEFYSGGVNAQERTYSTYVRCVR